MRSVASYQRHEQAAAVANWLSQCRQIQHLLEPIYTPPLVFSMLLICASVRSSPERTLHLIGPPINLYLALIHILIDPLHPLADTDILPLALLEYLEDQVSADTRVICIAKVLINALLERFDALAHFFGIVRVHKLLEDGSRVRRTLSYGLGRAAAGCEEGFSGFDELLEIC